MDDRGIHKWPVLVHRERLLDGMEVKVYVIPMPGGSMICDEFGRPLCMKEPGVPITPEFLDRLFYGTGREN